MRGDYVAVVPRCLIEWGERLNIVVDSGLVEKAVRQYLKHINQTRAYRCKKQCDHDWRRRRRRQNKASAARLRADRRAET